jgi:flagellar hook-associated protein 1 FlgK
VGSATISQPVVNAPPPTDANLQQTVTITFNNPPTTFDVVGVGTGNPVGVGYVSGGNITYNGFTTQIDGTPQAGDVFSIESNVGGVSDNRNALLLTGLQTQPTVNGASDFQSAYSQFVAGVGTQTSQAGINRSAQEVLLNQSIENRESVSGVNLDEEAANLLRFQQSYQAAAQVIATVNTIFQTLINAVGR